MQCVFVTFYLKAGSISFLAPVHLNPLSVSPFTNKVGYVQCWLIQGHVSFHLICSGSTSHEVFLLLALYRCVLGSVTQLWPALNIVRKWWIVHDQYG